MDPNADPRAYQMGTPPNGKRKMDESDGGPFPDKQPRMSMADGQGEGNS